MSDTLIRAVLHMNPDELTDEEWAHQAQMSEWALSVIQAGKIE